MEKSTVDAAAPRLDNGTALAYERTYLAHERTQMAWVRTALSLISFGFTISKFFEYLHGKDGIAPPLIGARNVGLLMISIGLVLMVFANIGHRRAMVRLHARNPELPQSLAGIGAVLISVLGLVALVAALVRG
jgi:putative membrane protein